MEITEEEGREREGRFLKENITDWRKDQKWNI